MNENQKAAKALKQIELMKKHGARPDTWLFNPSEPEIVWPADRPDKMSIDEAEEVIAILDLPAMIVLPDNGR